MRGRGTFHGAQAACSIKCDGPALDSRIFMRTSSTPQSEGHHDVNQSISRASGRTCWWWAPAMRRSAPRSRRSENGAKVLMLEAAPFEERGGNSHFTGGAFRFAFRGVDDLISVLPSLAQREPGERRLRHLHRGAVLRRPVRADAIPHRSRALPRSWCAAAWRRRAGWRGRASSCSRGSAGRPTRSTASSSSGAGSRCTSGAAGRRCSRRSTPLPSGAASRSATRRRRSRSCARTAG